MDITYGNIVSLGVFAEFHRLARRIFGLNLAIANLDLSQGRLLGPRSEMNPFCLALQVTPEGLRRCQECDRQKILSVIINKKSIRYECHAGLSEFVIPILVNQQVTAILQCGQVLNRPPTEAGWKQTLRHLAGWQGNRTAMRRHWFQTRVLLPDVQEDVMLLLRLFAEHVVAAHSRLKLLDEGRQSRVVHRAQACIQTDYSQPLTLTLVARAAGTSPRNLTRIFHKETGETVLAFIRKIRLEQACEQLALTQKGVAEIAFECGFGSIPQFYRLFYRSQRCSPGEWRRRYPH